MKKQKKRKALFAAALVVIILAALICFLSMGIFRQEMMLREVIQVSLAEDAIYIVDLDDGEDEYRIIRSDTDGREGAAICFDQYDSESSRHIRQIFRGDDGEAYVYVVSVDLETAEEKAAAIYRCDFDGSCLEATDYDLSAQTGDRMQFQGIRDGVLYYFDIPETDDSSEVRVCALDPGGQPRVLDSITLTYNGLMSQFFLSENQTLLWMDYTGTVHIRPVGQEEETVLEGITDRSGSFMNLSDDGGNLAFVTDHEENLIRVIHLDTMETDVLFTDAETEFSLADVSCTDCTANGFVTVSDEGGLYVRTDDQAQYIDIVHLSSAVVDVNFSNQMTLVLLIVLVLVICLIYYHLRHRQTVLSRIILIFLVVIYFSDYFVEQWMEQAFTEQIIQTQDLALSMLGENLKNRIEDNLDEDGGLFLDGIADSEFFQRTGLSVSQEYEYTVIAPDEDGLLRVSASTQEYANVPIERRYTGEALEAIMETWESGESITVSDTDAGIGRRELFMTITRDDGTICGILAIAVNGGNFQAQIWRYDNSLRIIILAMMAIVFLVLVMVIIIFMRPLKRLKACADELADGKLGVTVPVRGHDEIAVIAEAFNHMSGGISRYVTDIREMSECYYKFIPAKMLTLLGKESIRQVELGDEISENMTILSMHAIDYPKQKLALSAEKVYANINHILSLMVASIVEQQGMVEHFEDSGLTALFTEDCRRALDAAISIHRSLDQNAPGEGRCVAVTYGRVMLGVIGNKNRMELTAISAHADLAKALRTKGDRYGARILITHLIYQQIPDFEQQYHARYLGNIYLSATDTMERIYDVYDGDPEDEFYYKELTKLLFEEGVNLFVSRKFYEARLVFVEVLKQHRRDSAAREYLYRCDRYYKLSSEEQKNADTVTERF